MFKEKNLKISMEKLKPIKRYSGVWIIKLIPTDAQDLKLKEGDLVDISGIIKKEKKKEGI